MMKTEEQMQGFCDKKLRDLPLAMAYLPMQQWKQVYEPDVALDRGTAFAELDLPFLGRRVHD